MATALLVYTFRFVEIKQRMMWEKILSVVIFRPRQGKLMLVFRLFVSCSTFIIDSLASISARNVCMNALNAFTHPHNDSNI